MKRRRRFLFRWYEVLGALLALSVVCFWLTSFPPISPSVSRRTRLTKESVPIIRREISRFKDVEGRYPNSLTELQQYCAKNQNLGFQKVFVAEYFSDPNGYSKEYDVLNGEGGWYYNKQTGDVKVNLTRPVKHYVKAYLGKTGNEIPADW